MKKKDIMEAYDNAEAAKLNLETAFARPEGERSGLIHNARQQLSRALKLIEDAELAAAKPKPEKPEGLPRVPWKHLETGVHAAQIGDYQMQVFKSAPSKNDHSGRGHWVATVHRRVPGKATLDLKSHGINYKSKTAASSSAIRDVMRFMEQDEERRMLKRSAGIGFDKLEAALEKARVQIWDEMKHETNVDEPMTRRDFSNLLDSFTSALAGALDPEVQ